LLQGLEVGTVRLAGYLPDFESAAVTCQAGAHQPDALSALVVGHDVLIHSAGAQITIAAPVGVVDPRASTRGGFADRLGSRHPMVDALVAESATRKRAAAAGADPEVASQRRCK